MTTFSNCLRHYLTIVLLFVLTLPATAAKLPKLDGANGLRFGWSLEKCVEAIGDVPRKMTKGAPDDQQRQFSYAPSRWGGTDWDGSVLDFSKNKLAQIGFYKTTTDDSRETFNAAKSHLSDLYGTPVEVQGTDNNLLWTGNKGNMALLQYVRENSKEGKPVYSTYLMFIDNQRVIRKAARAEAFLQELMKE
ncbi:MAG: hypothetical protein NC343_07835 [Muribaculum sp.]|nr:hypothetical protein [Muribaculaceae bacterium]MCM1081646.1 hypothetical protein [Muribaculum sp.]